MVEKKLFERYDSEYLEALSDEEFFSRRFELSEEDKAILEANSGTINGHIFYKSKVLDQILKPYATQTNPKPGEPGSRENPLVRYGRRYVYDDRGDLVEDVSGRVSFVLTPDMKPTDEQKNMIKKVADMPIVYDDDCPKSTSEVIEGFRRFGKERNEKRKLMRAT